MSNWIKCSERLPEYFIDVLVIDSGKSHKMGIASLCEWGWDYEDMSQFIELDEVTHWMPLPEPDESEGTVEYKKVGHCPHSDDQDCQCLQ